MASCPAAICSRCTQPLADPNEGPVCADCMYEDDERFMDEEYPADWDEDTSDERPTGYCDWCEQPIYEEDIHDANLCGQCSWLAGQV